MQIFFIVIFFLEGEGGGLKLGLNVFHHNNKFNLINIYSTKTITIEYKKYGSIYGVNKAIIWFPIHFLFVKSNSLDVPFMNANWSRLLRVRLYYRIHINI